MTSNANEAQQQQTDCAPTSKPSGFSATADSAAIGVRRQTGRPLSDTSRRIVELCNAPDGADALEIAGASGLSTRVVSGRVYNLISWGHLCKAGVDQHYRYFARPEQAQAWEAANAEELARQRARKALPRKEKARQRNKARRDAQRLANPPTRPRWSAADLATLREHYGRLTMAEIGVMVGRSENAVKNCADRIGLLQTEAQRRLILARAAVKRSVTYATKAASKHGRAAPVVIAPRHTAWDSVQPTIPAHVVVQHLPATRAGERFKADPALAGRGVISSDWKNSRLQEVQR